MEAVQIVPTISQSMQLSLETQSGPLVTGEFSTVHPQLAKSSGAAQRPETCFSSAGSQKAVKRALSH